MSRLSKPGMFIEMARVVAQRSTCQRLQVGCLITNYDSTSVVSMGYNGNAKGLPNKCDTTTPGECGCIHAELNALLKAPFSQGTLRLFTTHSPCLDCAKLILNSRVQHVIFEKQYRSNDGLYLLSSADIPVHQYLAESNLLAEIVE